MADRHRTFEVLVVEDNPADAELTREMLEEGCSAVQVTIAADAGAAMQMLQLRLGANLPQPAIVLLDLNLPGLSGLDFLAELRGNPRLRTTPVVVFSTSNAEADITNSYALGANSYVTKPFEVEDCRRAIGNLRAFWLSTAELPGRRQGGRPA
ncbi:MAG: response regulator [Acuticoccus sp.]